MVVFYTTSADVTDRPLTLGLGVSGADSVCTR